MADKEKDFIPEMRNPQSDHLPGGSLDSLNSIDSLDPIGNRLSEDVRRTYSSYAHENAESLWRVQRRLESKMRRSLQHEKTLLMQENCQYDKRKYMMNDSSTPHKNGWNQWSRTISTIAAVLVVAIIAGSALFLFNSRERSTQLGSSIQAPMATPKPPMPTSTPQAGCGLKMDAGERALCVKGLETPLNATKTVAGQKITFFAGYADTQRIILKYTAEKVGNTGTPVPAPTMRSDVVTPTPMPNPALQAIPTPMPTTSSTNLLDQVSIYPLTIQGGIDLGGGASSTYYDKQKQQWVSIVTFFADKVPAGTKELRITAHVMMFKGNGVAPVNDTITINTPLPFHTEKRVATPNQTVTVNGQAVTLERVVVTPSQTLIYLKNPTIAFIGSEAIASPQGTLSGSGWSLKTPLFSATTSTGTKQGAVIGGQFEIDEPLMDKAGTWIFTMQTFGGPVGQGTWTFKFTVPPQSQK